MPSKEAIKGRGMIVASQGMPDGVESTDAMEQESDVVARRVV